MVTYWMPTHGCGSTPGWTGLTSFMIFAVSGANSPPAWMYCGMRYVDFRVPGGVRGQPSWEPTSFAYSLDVAHWTNVQAASLCSDSALMPRFHDHSQPEF